MSYKFESSIYNHDEGTIIRLSGAIDEDNDLVDLIDVIPAKPCFVHLGGVDRINSCGVRDWVNWLNAIEAKPCRVVLIGCLPPIVAQINVVSNFTGTSVVKNFYLPYFCENCDTEKLLLVDTKTLSIESSSDLPSCRCDECDTLMEFDEIPDVYLSFLNDKNKIATDQDSTLLDLISKTMTISDGTSLSALAASSPVNEFVSGVLSSSREYHGKFNKSITALPDEDDAEISEQSSMYSVDELMNDFQHFSDETPADEMRKYYYYVAISVVSLVISVVSLSLLIMSFLSD